MLHLITGNHHIYGSVHYLQNGFFGIAVEYIGEQEKGTWFLHPQIDTNRQTIKYYAFDTVAQKERFFAFQKIQGIGSKHAYELAMKDAEQMNIAIEAFDLDYFTAFPGIGQKTAKRILIELKSQIDQEDIEKLAIDEKLYKDIIHTLHDLGYERHQIKKALPDCPHPLKKTYLKEIISRLIMKLT